MIEIKEEIQIGKIILEKGDKIKVLKEAIPKWNVRYVLNSPTGKNIYDDTLERLMTFIMQSFTWEEINDMVNDNTTIDLSIDGERFEGFPLEGVLPDRFL